MGGNASPFIADLCLAWAEYCFMVELVKSKDPSDYKLARTLSNNSRYIDDISVINHLGFGGLAKRIYHEELILEESEFGYHYDNFLDLSIRIHSQRFIMGIYHKVDDFNFEVINFPFPDSNIHSRITYNSFYSQLVRFFRLCNNVKDFSIRVKMLYNKLHTRGFSKNILSRYFLKFCTRYPIDIKFGFKDGHSLWEAVFHNSSIRSCCVYDYEAITDLTKDCRVVVDKLQPDKLKDFEYFKQSTSTSEAYSSEEEDEETAILDNDPSIVHFIPQSLSNPKNHCYINSCLQVFYRILLHFNEDIHFNNNAEGCLVKSLVDSIYSDSSDSLSCVKQQLARYNRFFSGFYQQDVTECVGLLMDILHLGTKENLLSLPSSSDAEDDQFIHSLTKRLFLFNLKHHVQCLKCRLISVSYSESRSYILYPSNNCSIEEILEKSVHSIFDKTCRCCDTITKHEELLTFEHPPEILVFIISRFNSNMVNDKNRDGVKVSEVINVSSCSYRRIGSIHHHGTTISSGHYTSNVWYPDAAFLCNDTQILPLNGLTVSDSVYMIFYSRNDTYIS